jgi:hypothetical protein
MLCRVQRQTDISLDAAWETFPWNQIPSSTLEYHMGQKPTHFPRTGVKIAYDERAIYLMFRVEDRYVRAVARENQDNVWEDSCVEFFFTPDTDLSKGYFNLEINCGGTLLFHFQPGAGKDRVIISKKDCSKIRVAHSMPQIVDPEIKEQVIWCVAYAIPISLLEKYCRVIPPGPGVGWRANFYKCGDKTSHPHWLTWSPVDFFKPNFHLPQFFGSLKFL